MDLEHVLGDAQLREELLARLPQVATGLSGSGLEGLDGGFAVDALRDDLTQMAEGAGGVAIDSGLEAIVLKFTRPVLMIQQGTVTPGFETFPDSEVIRARLAAARTEIETAVPSVGRIDLRNYRLDWVGTGWMVAPDIAVTNRHVAEYFARPEGAGFTFRSYADSRVVRASLDWRREHQRGEEAIARVSEVIWMEPDNGYDLALLRVRGEDAELPAPVPLMSAAELPPALSSWVAVVGYPDRSTVNSAEDQQRIFDGIYGVKRLAPGTVMSIGTDGLLDHDATTLGGNSGSLVLHLETGKAVGLHFGGWEGDRNRAVQAPVVAQLLAEHA